MDWKGYLRLPLNMVNCFTGQMQQQEWREDDQRPVVLRQRLEGVLQEFYRLEWDNLEHKTVLTLFSLNPQNPEDVANITWWVQLDRDNDDLFIELELEAVDEQTRAQISEEIDRWLLWIEAYPEQPFDNEEPIQGDWVWRDPEFNENGNANGNNNQNGGRRKRKSKKTRKSRKSKKSGKARKSRKH
jgi:hypothetical protein